LQKSGRSSGLRLETKCRSMTTASSFQTAPALIRSSLIPGDPVTLTPLSHHSKSEDRVGQLQVIEAFFTTKLSNFITQLKEAQIFDDTLIVFGSGMSDGSRHSNRDLPVILAGGGIKHQGHVVCPKEDHKRVPLANLWLSTLHWFGVESDHFGNSTGTFTPMELV
jgi:hypothetical protein